ncbi:MAG TPA: carbohydrate ABC transporter permease, partial [Dermatophilaceae bacterium]
RLVTQSPELKTMVTGLASLTSGELGSGTQFPLKMGAALLTTITVALIFFAFHRHFIRGGNEGGGKG